MAKRLTDKFLSSLKSPASGRLVVADAAAPGLSLRVTEKGAMSWLVRYRPKGRAQRGVVLGPYPSRSLADARQRAAEIVAAAKKGVDLIEEEDRQKEVAERAKARARSVAEVSEDFLKASERLKSHRPAKEVVRQQPHPTGDRRPDRWRDQARGCSRAARCRRGPRAEADRQPGARDVVGSIRVRRGASARRRQPSGRVAEAKGRGQARRRTFRPRMSCGRCGSASRAWPIRSRRSFAPSC